MEQCLYLLLKLPSSRFSLKIGGGAWACTEIGDVGISGKLLMRRSLVLQRANDINNRSILAAQLSTVCFRQRELLGPPRHLGTEQVRPKIICKIACLDL